MLKILDSMDFKFLEELQVEMVNQDTDAQASPRFWVIRDYEWEISGDAYYDKITIYIPKSNENYEITDFIVNIENYYETLVNDLPDELLNELRVMQTVIPNVSKEQKEEICLKWIQDNLTDEVEIIYESNIPRIVPNTFFLTKREAQEHIKANHYHYSDKVHTYGMTAWRSPQVERLYEILEKTNWTIVQEMLNDRTILF